MGLNTTTVNLPLMVEILEDLRVHHVLECKFEKRMRETQESMNWNSRGILSPYTTELDYTHFGVGENGVIQGGGQVGYQTLKQTMRSLWKTVPITGELNRIKSEQFVGVKEQYGAEISDPNILSSLASGQATRIILEQAVQVFGRLKNYYAINGVDSSAIGVVTDAPTGTTVPFSWATTDSGNRFIKKGQKIQFYDTSATTLRRLAAHYTAPRTESEQYSEVSTTVDTRASVNVANSGAVTFDVLPTTALAAGDTAHILQGYGAMPQGFLHWVNDTGNLLGSAGNVARSSAPEVFISVIQNNSSATENTPRLMAAMESYFRGMMSDNEPIAMEIWMNKAQVFKYQMFATNTQNTQFNVQRWADLTAPTALDVGVPHAGLSFNNIKIEEDFDVPPSKNLWIDWMGWMVDVETPTTIYEFHQNQQMYQMHNSYGEKLDAKEITMFTQYNNRCTKFKTQGFQDDLAFDADQIGQP